MIDLATANMRELVTFFNHNQDEQRVESFPSLAAGRAACEPLMEDAWLRANFGVTYCANKTGCGIRLSEKGVHVHHRTDGTQHKRRMFRCNACGDEFGPFLPKGKGMNPQFHSMTMQQLVRYYNENAYDGRSVVTRFSTHEVAVKRCAALKRKIDARLAAPVPDLILEAERASKAKPKKALPAKKKKAAPKKKASPAKAVASSWEDDDVRAKRAQRSAVEVDGERYGSVKKAYEALGLPLAGHVKFRQELKEKGKLQRDGRKWKIVPLNY